MEVPVIAAINGPAIGAGLDLALMCNIRIAGESARFAESFVKLGIIPGDGGAFLLQKIVGIAKAAEWTFTGRTILPAEALACGLASEVVPDDALLPRAHALAAEIAQNPPQALRMAKRLLREAQTAPITTVLELALAHATDDYRTSMPRLPAWERNDARGSSDGRAARRLYWAAGWPCRRARPTAR